MVRRWQGWFPALAVTLATVGLAILDLTDTSLRRWWQTWPASSRARM